MKLLSSFFGSDSALLFVVFMGLFATILTQFIDNEAAGVALMPIIYSYCSNTGAAPEIAVMLVVLGVHLAFLTPAASSSAALLHGNEWSDVRSIWKTSPLVILASWAIMTLVTVVMGSFLF